MYFILFESAPRELVCYVCILNMCEYGMHMYLYFAYAFCVLYLLCKGMHILCRCLLVKCVHFVQYLLMHWCVMRILVFVIIEHIIRDAYVYRMCVLNVLNLPICQCNIQRERIHVCMYTDNMYKIAFFYVHILMSSRSQSSFASLVPFFPLSAPLANHFLLEHTLPNSFSDFLTYLLVAYLYQLSQVLLHLYLCQFN